MHYQALYTLPRPLRAGVARALTRCWTARPVKAVTPRTLLVANMLALRRRRGVGPGGRVGRRGDAPDQIPSLGAAPRAIGGLPRCI